MPLRAARRRRLPDSAFAYPSVRKYPIDTLKRARNALSRSAQKRTYGSYSHVARAVRRRYGGKVATVGRKRGTVSAPGYRKTAPARRRRTAGRSRPSTARRRSSSRRRSTGRRSRSTGRR
jgi:hypothetical protein